MRKGETFLKALVTGLISYDPKTSSSLMFSLFFV